MLKGAIFDMDGTLIDSMMMWRGLAEQYIRSLGLEPEADLKEKIRGLRFHGLAEYVQQCYGLEKTPEQTGREMLQLVGRFYADEVRVKDGVIEFLQQLQALGVDLCVATATNRDLAQIALDRCGLTPYFSGMFCTAEAGRNKNFPDVFRKALEHLGTDRKNTMVFEDAHYALCTAKKDGFLTAAVYDRFEPRQEEMRKMADVCIADYRHTEAFFEFILRLPENV